MKKYYLSIDLGATSGRATIGFLHKNKLETIEIHRFTNSFVPQHDHLFWNIYGIFEEILKSIQSALKNGYQITSIGIDSWGVDFSLIDEAGYLCGLPYAYRDKLTDGIINQFSTEVMNLKKLYKIEGIQLMQINSVFQLYAQKKANLPAYKNGKSLLFIPDVLSYLLCGKISVEYTISSTSSLLNSRKRNWDFKLIKLMGIAKTIFPEIVHPGTIKGALSKEISAYLNTNKFPIVAVASHDTASAVAAIPAKGTDWAFLSMGTWSLMGIETQEPIINDEVFNDGFTNEGGVNNTIIFLKNLTGLWLIEQLMSAWKKQGKEISYAQIDKAVLKTKPFQQFIDTNYPAFNQPGNIIELMSEYLKKTNQTIPKNYGEWARCIFESLALKYRYTLDKLRLHSPSEINVIHAIGGGTKNKFLCQLTANATQLPVIAGPVEATSMGNILVQAIAMKELKSFADIRNVVKASIQINTYAPVDKQEWDVQYQKFLRMQSTNG